MLIPGDKREMTEFIEKASQRSRIHLELCLPSGHLTVPSKHLYELIYNRLSTDLLLWEPAQTGECTTDTPLASLTDHILIGQAAFTMCKSNLNVGKSLKQHKYFA